MPRTMADRRAFVAAVIGLVLINELLMGWTFQRVAGGPPGSAGAGLLGVFVGTIVSPWFLFPMALEMALSALWIGRRFVGPMMAIFDHPAGPHGVRPPGSFEQHMDRR